MPAGLSGCGRLFVSAHLLPILGLLHAILPRIFQKCLCHQLALPYGVLSSAPLGSGADKGESGFNFCAYQEKRDASCQDTDNAPAGLGGAAGHSPADGLRGMEARVDQCPVVHEGA